MGKLIEIINRVSGQLINNDSELQIYQIMNDGIRELIPEVYFLISKLQSDDMNFRIAHSFGFDKFVKPIQTLLGKNPIEMDFPFSDLNETKIAAFNSGQLFHFNDGLYDLTCGKINKTSSKIIETILGVSQIYAISFSIEKNYFGGAIFFIPKRANEPNLITEKIKLAIETISHQASSAINNIRYISALKEKEKDLVISHSRFNQLVKQMNDMVWQANGDGTEIIDLNNSFEKYYGFSSSEFVKNPNLWFEVIHPDDKTISQQASKELLKTGKSECEYRIVKPDGTIAWLHDRKSMIFDTFGKPIQMGGIATDITEKKKLEEQLVLKNHALDNSPNAIALTGFDGVIFYVNEAFVKLWGYKSTTGIIGKHYSEFSSKNYNPKELFNTLNKGKTFIGEDKPLRKDGTTFACVLSASIVKVNKKPFCTMVILTDISERSKMEAQLREHGAVVTKLNKEKDDFFNIISHDLRSPFHGILALLQILKNEYHEYSDEERYKIIEASHDSAQNTFNLLSDLLEWARLQNQQLKIKKETLNLNDVINENIVLYERDALEKEISIENKVDPKVIITVDRNSLQTVIRNLLNNSIKFTNHGGFVEFDVKQNKNDIILSIKDNGVGMQPELVNKLFRINEHVTKPGTNNEQGTGLGLTICSNLVTINNWKMDIESQLGKGTTFKVLIPS